MYHLQQARWAGMDIEIADDMDGSAPDYNNLRISCAAVKCMDRKVDMFWPWQYLHANTVGYFNADAPLTTHTLPDDTVPIMDRSQCQHFVRHLQHLESTTWNITTWNGMSFDFRVLAAQSGMWEECARLALNHVDGMFHFFMTKGFPIGLQAAADGAGVQGKIDMGEDGVHGEAAPEMWRAGQYKQVMTYLEGDCDATNNVMNACQQRGKVSWIAKSGRANTAYLRRGWLPVKEAAKLRLPNTSWMSEPIPKKRFFEWIIDIPGLENEIEELYL